MYIKSLEQMETIVNNNKSLSWDGWTVVSKYKSDKGRTSKYGSYDGKYWYINKRFSPDVNGWNIPESFINAQT